MHLKTLACAILLLPAAAAIGADADADQALLDKINPAWQRLEARAEELSEAQRNTLHALAFATAAGEFCPRLNVDREKFVAAFRTFIDDSNRGREPVEQEQLERKILVLFGVATGLISAEALLLGEGFCESADRFKLSGATHYWE